MININISLVIQLGNFLIVYFLLKHLFFAPLLQMMDQRKKRLSALEGGFSQEKAEIAALEDEYRQKLSAYMTQAAEIVHKGRVEGDMLASQSLASVQEKANSEFDSQKARIDEELKELRASLTNSSKDLVTAIVGRFS